MSKEKPLSLIGSPFTLAMTTAMALASANASALIIPVATAGPCTPVGTTYTVTTEAGDISEGSFRQAVENANDNEGCDEIVFDESVSDIELTGSAYPHGELNIEGNGAASLNISYPAGSVINASANNLHIADLTISNSDEAIGAYTKYLSLDGVVLDGSNVGLSANVSVDARIINSTIMNHDGSSGLYINLNGSESNILIDNSIIKNNIVSTNQAGGLYVNVNSWNAELDINNSYFYNNASTSEGKSSAKAGGAEIRVSGGSLTVNVENTSFVENNAYSGGAFYIDASDRDVDLNIKQSTFSGNTSGYSGGGAAIQFYASDVNSSATVNIDSSTIYDNRSDNRAGGVYINTNSGTIPPVTVRNSVIAFNKDDNGYPNFEGYIATVSNSWIGDSSGISFGTIPGDHTVTDGGGERRLLLALADNGGVGLTHMPASNSPLVDMGEEDIEDAADTDQNGSDRIVNGRIDIGATELPAAEIVPEPEPEETTPESEEEEATPEEEEATPEEEEATAEETTGEETSDEAATESEEESESQAESESGATEETEDEGPELKSGAINLFFLSLISLFGFRRLSFKNKK